MVEAVFKVPEAFFATGSIKKNLTTTRASMFA